MNSTTGIKLGPKDVVFAIIGPTGVGKSTFINVARGRDVTPVGQSTSSCTKQPLPIIFDPIPDFPKLEGYRLVLLDTPGFDDTNNKDKKNSERIAKWLRASRRKGALVGGVLYLYDITVKRFNDKARQNLLKPSTSAWCDDMRKSVIVTTNWPSDPDEYLSQREKEMKDEHWKSLIENGLQVWRFLGDYTSAWDVINSLLHHIDLSPTPKLPVNGKEIKLGRQDIIFPVMGPTGAGKSTFINIALGNDVTTVGHSTTSCTNYPLPITIDPIPNCPRLKGYRLVLVDMPGFDHTHEEDEEILRRIAEWLEVSRRNGSLVGGVLFLHDISIKRFTGTARQSLLMFSRLCGYNAMPKTLLVTTNWPSDRNVVLERREEEMKGEDWKTLIEKGLEVRRFQRNRDSAWEIINHLLEGIPLASTLFQVNDIDERLDLQIQAELIKLRMAIPETEAGRELGYTLQQLLKMQQEAVALEESFARTGDREAQTNLENIRATIGKLQDQVKDLRIRLSLPKRFLRMFGIKSGKRR